MDYKEFPQLINKMEKKKVQKILLECNNNWEKAEERINSQKQLLFYLAELLVHKNKYQEAASIIHRHKLNQNFSNQINQLSKHFELNELLQNQIQKNILNRILERDGFGPTEVLCFLEEDEYLNLSEYGIQERDVYFIDKICDKYNQAVKVLSNTKLIGFDSEFIPRWNKFEKGGVATLQLSTDNQIFIFDSIKLIHEQKFIDFITFLFESEEILKVGHSIWQDINELDKTFKCQNKINVKGFLDVGMIHKQLMNLENVSSLKLMSYQILQKKVSKYEQISDWSKRPLRKCQIHYAALDALLPLKLYQEINKMKELGDFQNLSAQIKDAQILLIYCYNKKSQQMRSCAHRDEPLVIGKQFKYSKKYEHFFKDKQPKFLVDNMLSKLVKYLRNSGLDASFVQDKNYKLLCELSNKEERIILTRNFKFYKQITHQAPVFLIVESLNTEQQFKEILNFFKIQVSDSMILSRCIKCNGDKIVEISSQEAIKYVEFYNPQYTEFQFWQCLSCKQVYWEGEKFKRSKERFNNITQIINQKLSDDLDEVKMNNQL